MVSNVEQWVTPDDEAINDTGTYQDTLDTIIFGKNSYQPLVEYWTHAETASSSNRRTPFQVEQTIARIKLILFLH